MFYILIISILAFCAFIFLIISNYQKSKLAFENKIKSLENSIVELTKSLDIQTQKVKLSEDLKLNMRNANNYLSAKIVAMNLEMFGELFSKK